jgi:peptidoglycan/xylan/chitin deacetylase (PgdA/CDA1 family)
MKKCIAISIDIEPDIHTDKYSSLKALPEFLKILHKYNIKATFFTTCDCLEKKPQIFKKIKKEGHEISLHGYEHKRFDVLSTRNKEIQIKKSIECFKKHLSISPKGFRAPQHSIDDKTIKILRKNNFKYDSSLIPWNLYHIIFFWKIYVKFIHNFAPMKIHKRKGLLEVPMSSFILPFSSITLRILPKSLLMIYLHLISFFKNPVFLMHSWDLIEVPNSKLYKLCPLPQFLEKLEYMLNFFSKKRKFLTIDELAHPI